MANSVEFQVQLKAVDGEGREANLCPQNTVEDIWTGALESGTLQLPGSSPTERLQQTLQNIRMYLYNLSLISDVRRQVVTRFDSDSTTDIASAKSLKLLKEVDDNTIANLKEHDETRATSTVFSHVKLSDSFETSAGAASDSVGASSKALYDAYTKANKTAADNLKSHADSRSTASKFFHVALTDEYSTENSTTQAAANSIAASGYALYRAYKYAKDSLTTHADSRATSTVYSHVRLSDSYGASDGAAADSVGASSKALHDAYTKANKTAADNLKTHSDSRSTASVFSHVALTDDYTTENSKTQAASNSIAASGYALYRAYKYAKDSLQTHADSRANATDYSHVKLTDTFEQSMGAATSSVAPSSKALYDAYTKANKTAADNLKSHSDSRATGAAFSHVALTDDYNVENSTTQAAANSIAASGYALYKAYKYAKDSLTTHQDTKATDAVYSHVKLSDGYTTSAGAAADAVGASSKALYDAYTKANKTAADNLKSHADSRSTDKVYSHVALTDEYTTENSATQAAANAVGASGYALFKAYKYAKDSLQSHADSKATASAYSHVKLTDAFETSSGAATNSIAPSSKALYDAYTKANKTAADNLKSHADSRSTAEAYSHVALTDEYAAENSATQAAANAVGASGYALYRAYKYAKDSLQSHADSRATASAYSHVKLSDSFETSDGAAADSVGASSKALYDAYTKSNKTGADNLKSHVDSRSTSEKYSHVALTDEYTTENSATQAAANAVGASGYALYKAYKYAKDSLQSHANSKATASAYSHVKLTDAFETSSGAAADSVGASSKALYDAYTKANKTAADNLKTHSDSRSTAEAYSHVALTDDYNVENSTTQAAANSIGASGYALYKAYKYAKDSLQSHADSRANATNYSHVKLSDSYTKSGGAAADSVGASSKALYDAYTKANKTAADNLKTHSDSRATDAAFSHVALTDEYAAENSTTQAAANAVGASGYALYREHTYAKNALTTHQNTKASGTVFSHVKLSDGYTASDGAAADAVGASSKALYDAYTSANKIASDALTAHAAVNGVAATKGHVKLADSYTTSGGAAADSVGASSKALVDAYNALNAAKAPKNHATSATTYGKGTTSAFGHLKVSDVYDSSVSGANASGAVAASQNALYNAYAALLALCDQNATDVSGKAVIAHASTEPKYGVGTVENYGHVKLSDDYNTDNSTTAAAANSIAASSWAVYRAYSAATSAASTALSNHNAARGTSSAFGHVKLSDNYTSSAGAASAAMGASSKAVYDAYTAANSNSTSKVNTHAAVKATASALGHVTLSDDYATDNSKTGAAANSIGASSYAVYRAYSAASSALSTHSGTKATASVYAHVKLSDAYTSSGGAAADSVGASSKAVVDAYNAANTNSTNKVNTHSAVKATASVLGHVTLSDDYATENSTTGAAANSIGASSYAVYRAYTAANSSSTSKVNTHAAVKATASALGHVTLSDDYATENSTTGAAANSIGASSYAVYRAYNAASSALSTHSGKKATASVYAHVKLSDAYTSSGGAASAAVGASSKAVNDAYNAANTNSTNKVNTHAAVKATDSVLGHVTLSDEYATDNSTTGAAANAIGASSYAVYRAYNAASTAINNHAAVKGVSDAFGHVKLSDAYTSSGGAAADSVGASSKAVNAAYTALNNAKAPKAHASTGTTYGIGTGSNYGHVKLSDTYDSAVTNGAAANALAASQNALYNAYSALLGKINTNATNISGKAPTSHASTGTGYGAGTGSNYGHVKLSDAYDTDNSTTGAAANAIGASSYAVYRAYSAATSAASTALANHAAVKGVSGTFGHVKLSDNYTSSAGAASASIGASSKAVVDAYNALNSAKAPKSHASTGTGYGVGNASNYGHVKLSDAYTSSAGAAANAIGASSKALYDAYTALNNAINTLKGTALQRNARYVTASDKTIALTLSAVTGSMAFTYTASSLVLNGTYLFLLKCNFTNVANMQRVMVEAYMNVTPSGGSAANKALIEAACDMRAYATSFGGTVATSTNPAMGIHTFSSNHTVNSISLFAGIGLHDGLSTATVTISSAELFVIKIPV